MEAGVMECWSIAFRPDQHSITPTQYSRSLISLKARSMNMSRYP